MIFNYKYNVILYMSKRTIFLVLNKASNIFLLIINFRTHSSFLDLAIRIFASQGFSKMGHPTFTVCLSSVGFWL